MVFEKIQSRILCSCMQYKPIIIKIMYIFTLQIENQIRILGKICGDVEKLTFCLSFTCSSYFLVMSLAALLGRAFLGAALAAFIYEFIFAVNATQGRCQDSSCQVTTMMILIKTEENRIYRLLVKVSTSCSSSVYKLRACNIPMFSMLLILCFTFRFRPKS